MAGSQDQMAEQYRLQQATLRALVVRDVLHLWLALFDPVNATASWVALRTALTALIRDRGSMSAALATRYYSDARTLAGVSGSFRPLPAALPDPETIGSAEDGAGLGGFLRSIKAGQSVDLARKNASVGLSGVAGNLVLDVGRDTVTEAVAQDKAALGWARVTDAHPCAFCAMLAGRGPVYRSEGSASFQAHPHCACVAAAVWSRDEAWLGHSRDLQEQWQQATRGKSGAAALKAWRQHWNGQGTVPAR